MRARSPNEVLNWLVVVLAFSLPLYRAWVSLAAYLILGESFSAVGYLGAAMIVTAVVLTIVMK